jgi:hypothetical protein
LFTVLGLDVVSSETLFGYEGNSRSPPPGNLKETIILPDTTNILQAPIQVTLLRFVDGMLIFFGFVLLCQSLTNFVLCFAGCEFDIEEFEFAVPDCRLPQV